MNYETKENIVASLLGFSHAFTIYYFSRNNNIYGVVLSSLNALLSYAMFRRGDKS